MRIETISRIPTAWSGVHRHFAVHLFQGRVTVDEMEQLDVISGQWRRRNPGKLVELVVIFPSDNQMTGDERARMSQIIKRWEKERSASATVILAEGIMGSLHRSVLTGMLMLAPPPHPGKVFGQVSEAVTWLTPYVATLWNAKVAAADLQRLVDAYCVEFGARPVDLRRDDDVA
jgi:hypothetical protein